MAEISFEEAFGRQPRKRKTTTFEEAFGGNKWEKKQRENAKRVADAPFNTDFVRRSLAGAGFNPDDVEVGQIQDPTIRKDAIARRDQITGRLAEDKELQELSGDIANTNELLLSTRALLDRRVRTVEDFQREAIEDLPRPLRPFATGFVQAGMRSSSVLARSLETIGALDEGTADQLIREGKKLSEIRASLGTSRIEDAMESAVTSLTEVFTTAGLGLGTKGVALASGIRVGNASITEGRDAGLEGLELASFAAGQGIIETGLTLTFNKLLGPGLEAVGQPMKEAGKAGILSSLKRLGINSLAELPEELTIELLSAYASGVQGVGPELTVDQAKEIGIQTTLTTMLTMGMAEGLNIAQQGGLDRNTSISEQVQGPVAEKPKKVQVERTGDSILITKKRLAELKKAANEDPLTGLGNRRIDDRAVETLFKRADRAKTPTALVSFDIANFKALNDTLGLAEGDTALQIIADSIQAEVRTEREGRGRDIAGVATRTGGDEFNIILPNTNAEGGQKMAKRIQARVGEGLKAAGIDLPAEGRPVFAAPGVVERAPGDPRSIEDLRKEADFAVKAEKKRVKTELGVPLTREEAAIDAPATPQESAPAVPSEKVVPPTPAPTKEAEAKPVAQERAPLTKAQEAGVKRQAKRVVKKAAKAPLKETEAQAANRLKAIEAKTKRQAFGVGFRAAAREGRLKLDQMKRRLQTAQERQLRLAKAKGKDALQQQKELQAEIDQDRKGLADLARTLLPPQERGKLLPAILKAKGPRQIESLRGRIVVSMIKFETKLEQTRFQKEQQKLRKVGIKIPTAVTDFFGADAISQLKTTDPRTLTAAQAEEMANVIAQVRTLIKEVNNLRLGTEKADLQGAAELIVAEMKKSAPTERAETERAGVVSVFFNEANTKPEELLERMGENVRRALHDSMKKGRAKTMEVEQQYEDNFRNKFDQKKLAKWSRHTAGKRVKTLGLKLESGKTVTLTYMEAATVIAAANTAENRADLLKSGFTLRRKRADKAIKLTEQDLELIQDAAVTVDRDIMRFALEAKRYLNQDLKPEYDKTFQDLNGYSNIIKDYFPKQRDIQGVQKVPDSSDFNALNNSTLEQIRETKQRTRSNLPLLIDDLSSLLDNHVRRVGLYIGMARPIRNANLVLGHPDVAREMDSRFGTQRRAFLKRRMDQIVQSAVGYRPSSALSFFNDVTARLIDKATVGVLGLNPAVAAKQLASFVTASTEIDSKFMVRGAKSAFSRKVEDRMLEHSVQARARYRAPRIRLVGQFVDRAGIMIDRGGLSEKVMGIISKMDKAVIRSIWRASEIEISETTDLAFGTPEYFAKVNERFNQIVDRTQPAFDIVDQAGIALEGRTNSLAKLAGAMFMSQRNQNFTMMRRAARRGGVRGVKDMTLVALVAPAIIASIDWLRREAYGFNEDKTAGQQMIEGLFNLMESNLSVIYGSQIALDMVAPIKQAVLGEPIRFRGRENVLESSIGRIGRGVADSVAAVQGIGETIKQGDKRGQSQAMDKLKSAVENFSIGIGTLSGVPLSTPVMITKSVGRHIWTDDYSIMFKERTKLRKLDKEGKLSDFQKEKLNIMEQAFALTNIAQRAHEQGQISKDVADSYIQDQMRGMVLSIEAEEGRVPDATFSPQEKPTESEEFLRAFYKTHGQGLFDVQILSAEANQAKAVWEGIKPSEKRAFARLNPDVMEQVGKAQAYTKIKGDIAKLRKVMNNPRATAAQRERASNGITKLIEAAKKVAEK